MSQTAVSAGQFPNSWAGVALTEHRSDREALLQSLSSSLRDDPRVRACWLWGSFGRGDADDLSDLDLWLIVVDEAVPVMGPVLRRCAERAGGVIAAGENPRNAPPRGGYFSLLHEGRHGLLHLDCYWQAESAAGAAPDQAVLFNRLHEPLVAPLPVPPTPEAAPLDGEEACIQDGIGFAWLMLSIAAKMLARDPNSDMRLMLYPKPGFEEAAVRLGEEEIAASTDWSVPEEPADKLRRLRHLVRKTDELTRAAIAKGAELSPRSAACLDRYLDLVGGILEAETK